MTELNEALITFLFNALWQVAMVCAAAQAGAWLLRDAPARFRYRVWFAARVVAVALPAGSTLAHVGAFSVFRHGLMNPQHPSLWFRVHGMITPDSLSLAPLWMHLVIWCYCAFLVHGAARLGWAAREADRLLQGSQEPALPESAKPIPERCRTALGIRRVRIRRSTRVRGPVTIGVCRAQILVPEEMAERATEADWISILSHEMAHVRRKDFAKSLVCDLLSLPARFHPAALWMKSRLAAAREQACDEMATERCIEPQRYAHSLLALAGSMRRAQGRSRLESGVGIFDGNVLEERIRNVLRGRRCRPAFRARASLAVYFAALLVTCLTASAFTIRVWEKFTPCAPVAAPAGKNHRGAPAQPETKGPQLD